MKKFDLYFHYRNVVRYVIFNKFSSKVFNSYEVLNFSKVFLYFSIKNLENFDDFCVSNYHFFFFFFFGGRSFFFDFKSIFTLGIVYYNFLVKCFFVKRYIFFVLNFMLNEILIRIKGEKIHLIKQNLYWNYCIRDVSFFNEKWPVLGLFNLRHDLNIRFFFSCSWKNDNVLFSLFKL
jgi:hypothetical protein